MSGSPADSARLAEALERRGALVTTSAGAAPDVCRALDRSSADLLVFELDPREPAGLALPAQARTVRPAVQILARSRQPSTELVVRAHRGGFDWFLATYHAPDEILDGRLRSAAADPGACDPLIPRSLQRARWEYLSRVFLESGSLAQAGRRLDVDRRSLRRMLAKYPAAR